MPQKVKQKGKTTLAKRLQGKSIEIYFDLL
jgi:hypothetical protein